MSDKKNIDVDQAWNKVWSRLNERGNAKVNYPERFVFSRRTLLKAAAAVIIMLSFGGAVNYLVKNDLLSRKTVVATGNDEKNLKVLLPDESVVFLNRNTKLSYKTDFGKSVRNVTLTGEAFFEIKHDPEKQFTVDAGKAKVKVTGTSFNIITNNYDSAVEVFVESGQVILSDNSGNNKIILDPGYIGVMDSELRNKTLNDNPNYRSWNTGLLKYNGQTLDVVFRDLKRHYNMEIVAEDPDILEQPWTIMIDNEQQDTIIRVICASFNLSYTKDGNVYHLRKK